ncbi:antibiotic biosynthesis monooxygenase [bacterium]|nr:antibiotic biosynthesis monooxygenase [bacterium]
MIVTCVNVYVKEEYIDDFIEATIENHKNSILEPGNMRFDVLQQKDDRKRFTLYEAYESPEAAAEHKMTEHYLKWRRTVADWMAQPREGIPHDVIAPLERNQW